MKTLPVPEHHLTLLNIFKQWRMQTDTTQHKVFPHDSVQHVHFRLYAKYEIIQTYTRNR